MKVAGHSHEIPRRWWFNWGLGEIRVYNRGFELYLGPSRRFVVIEFGSDSLKSKHVYWVTL